MNFLNLPDVTLSWKIKASGSVASHQDQGPIASWSIENRFFSSFRRRLCIVYFFRPISWKLQSKLHASTLKWFSIEKKKKNSTNFSMYFRFNRLCIVTSGITFLGVKILHPLAKGHVAISQSPRLVTKRNDELFNYLRNSFVFRSFQHFSPFLPSSN